MAAGKNNVKFTVNHKNDLKFLFKKYFNPWYLFYNRTECYDYLFDIAVQMKKFELDPLATPEEYELKYQKGEKKAEWAYYEKINIFLITMKTIYFEK